MLKPRIFNKSKIEGVKIIRLDAYSDNRGLNFEGYNKESYIKYKIFDMDFLVDSFSISKKNSLRGMHSDKKNFKLIQCLYGHIQLFLFDNRKESKTYEVSEEHDLFGTSPTQILLPPGVTNGHLILTDQAVFSYKLTENYTPINEQIHVKYNDPRILKQITWKSNELILSERDK